MSDAHRTMEIYLTGQRNQHAVETQAIGTIQNELPRMKAYPDLHAKMQGDKERSTKRRRASTIFSRSYGIFVGQVIGAAAGFVGIYAVQAIATAKFIGDHDLSYDRLWAIIIAVAISAFAQSLANAKSPAGGATALVVSIGAETPNLMGAVRLAIGIALVTILGEIGRRVTMLVLAKRDAPRP